MRAHRRSVATEPSHDSQMTLSIEADSTDIELIIVSCTSDMKDAVYVRAEGEFINRIFHVRSAKNDSVHGRSVVRQ